MGVKTLKQRVRFIGAGVVIFSLILIVVIILYIRSYVEADMNDHMNAMIDATSAQVKAAVELPLDMIGQVHMLIAGESSPASSEVSAYLEAVLAAHGYFQEIYIYSESGHVLNCAPYKESLIGTTIGGLQYKNIQPSEHFQWSEVFISPGNGEPTISAIFKESDIIVVANLELSRLPLNIDYISGPDTASDLAILDKYGTFIVTEDMNDVYMRKTHPLFKVGEQDQSYKMDRIYVNIKEIEDLGWYVVHKYDLSYLYRNINFISVVVLIGWMVMSGITMLFTYRYFRSADESFRELQLRTHRLVDSKQYEEKVMAYEFPFEEFRSLAVDFDAMREKVEAREREVKELNADLERRITERTATLEDTNQQLEKEVRDRVDAEARLIEVNRNLDRMVSEKTNALRKANQRLVADIQSAVETNNAKNRFLAVMSHEMRTPLNGIIGFLQMIDDAKLGKENKELIDIIRNSADVLLSLINDVLDVSKYQADKATFHEEDFDLREAVRKVVETYKVIAKEKFLEFQCDFNVLDEVWVRADRLKLIQLVNNLLNNAMKFTSVGYVKISLNEVTTAKGRQFSISVEDSGIGIREEVKPHLFQPFTQADAGITRDFGGTGLGLTICKQIVSHYQGSIDFNSIYGVGTTFTAKFVLKEAEDHQTNNSPMPQASGMIMGRNILVAEDNEVNRKLMDTFFKRNGLKCDMAVNGQEAVKAARNRDYDVIFMDCHMPVMDGFEATQAIRKWNNKVRIFAMTAYTGDEDRERCILSGMDGYFAKPVDLDEIKSLLGLKEEVNNVMKEEVKDEERRDAFDHCVNELVENLGFDRETCVDLMETYVSQAKGILSDLRLLAEDKDWIAMGHKLHQLKGASGAVRLEGHRKRAEKAEQLMKSDRHEESLSVVMGLEKDPLFQNG